jgi:glutathione S-transferase
LAAAARGKKPPRSSKPIDVYYWSTPNGWKITIMLEECGLPYNVIPVNIAKGEQFKPDFLAISPNNRMPAIIDPDGPGGRPIAVFESGAILQYLGRKTGKFYRPMSASAPRSSSGCSGKWADLGRWPDKPTTSAATRRSRSITRSSATLMK